MNNLKLDKAFLERIATGEASKIELEFHKTALELQLSCVRGLLVALDLKEAQKDKLKHYDKQD